MIPMLLAGLVVSVLAMLASAWPSTRGPAPQASGVGAHAPYGWTAEPSADTVLRLGTFNIHSAIGTDDRLDLRRIATVLREASLDIIALQEVDAGAGYRRDQTQHLAESLNRFWLTLPREVLDGDPSVANALLSNATMQNWSTFNLTKTKPDGYRNVTVARVQVAGRQVNLIITHTDGSEDQADQLRVVFQLLTSLEPPVVLMGDLNTRPNHPAVKQLLARGDVVDLLAGVGGKSRIDWLLARGVTLERAEKVATDASDHPLYWAQVRLP